ncbi:MAG: PPC domain-containing protein [Phycisphaerae bacterium]
MTRSVKDMRYSRRPPFALCILPLAFCLSFLLLGPSTAGAQARPYIGFVYPAGGQQGTTFQIRIGGQNTDGASAVIVSGTGVHARITEYFGRLGNQEMSLMREQLGELQKAAKAAAAKSGTSGKAAAPGMMDSPPMMAQPGMMMDTPGKSGPSGAMEGEEGRIMARIEKRLAEYVNTPASAAMSSLSFVEVTIAPDAAPGRREIRLVTLRGISNPMVFHVGQVPETARKPMLSASLQVLGKEESALRKRPPEEEEVRIALPCTANGQIASGEVNRYRFEARKGQRLLLSVEGRSLNPYIADAVPGWFQPILSVCDADGKEMAFCDDYRFKPDPVIFFEAPKDGQYVASIIDAIYRGREDFVYRLTIGELPFVTGIFPLGGKAGELPKIEMTGWNIDKAVLTQPPKDAGPGIHYVTASKGGLVSNRLPFAVDTLPEIFEREPNNSVSAAQKVTLPVIVNGRIDRPDDWDVFQFTGQAGDTVVAEVIARRLESPLDSVLELTDATGKVLAMNDDHEDPEAGVNTHDADSYLMFKLPADGTYYIRLGDTDRNGGPEYAYRLRISQPRPDFSLFAVPTSAAMAAKGSAYLKVVAVRKDGFMGPITLNFKDLPGGFTATAGSVPKGATAGNMSLKTTLAATTQPVNLTVEGKAKFGQVDLSHEALPAEDRMQAFLWRHLVPAEDLKVLVYDPAYSPPPKRVPPPRPVQTRPASTQTRPAPASGAAKPRFSKREVAGLIRQLKWLYEEGLITDGFYGRKMAECEAAE